MAKKVDLISSTLVCSTDTAATAASITKLELNPLDLLALQIVPIQRGLIFHNPQFHSNSQQLLIQNLKNSLSRALHLFPPLAGRLTATAHDGDMASFFLDCNNAGAEFTHAVASSVYVSDIIQLSYIPEIVSFLFPASVGVTNFDGIAKPLFAVQVTELADGIFIGCSANHAVVDGTSFWHFVNSWSEISRGSESISKSPVFNRGGAGDNRLIHLPTLVKNLVSLSESPQKVFNFSRENLARLKGKANSEAGTDKISTLQAVMAHLWRSTVRSQRRNDSSSRFLVIAIGARSRMWSLEDGYFGNASYAATLAISESDLLEGGLGATALKMNELISQQNNETATRAAQEKVKYYALGGKGSAPPLIIGSSPRHNVYGCDFGWGKPVGVRSGKVHKVEGLVVVFPAVEGGGIDIEVCLAEETLRAMELDEEFATMLH